MRLAELRNWLGRARGGGGEAAADAWAEPQPPGAAAAAAGDTSGWTPLRLSVVETLWGEGFLTPGGSEEVVRLALPLGLSATSSLLLLGAGSGGPALRLAGDLGAWVSACEADPMLASVAARRVQRAGSVLAKRATVESWDPALPAFARRGFDHALAIEALHIKRPEDVLAALALAVRPGGQIALLQTVAPAPLDAADPAVAAWLRLEKVPLPLPSPATVGRTLDRLGFELRVAEDVSARHMRVVVAGWRRALRELDSDRPSTPRAAALVAEAELWLRRIRLMREGRLRLMRWFAIAKGGGGA